MNYTVKYGAYCQSCGNAVEFGEVNCVEKDMEKPNKSFENEVESAIPPCPICGDIGINFDWSIPVKEPIVEDEDLPF